MSGNPNFAIQRFKTQRVQEGLSNLVHENQAEYIKGASVFVRLCDARRDDEIIFQRVSVKFR